MLKAERVPPAVSDHSLNRCSIEIGACVILLWSRPLILISEVKSQAKDPKDVSAVKSTMRTSAASLVFLIHQTVDHICCLKLQVNRSRRRPQL